MFPLQACSVKGYYRGTSTDQFKQRAADTRWYDGKHQWVLIFRREDALSNMRSCFEGALVYDPTRCQFRPWVNDGQWQWQWQDCVFVNSSMAQLEFLNELLHDRFAEGYRKYVEGRGIQF